MERLIALAVGLIQVAAILLPIFSPRPLPQVATQPVLQRAVTCLDLPKCASPCHATAVRLSIFNRTADTIFTECWWIVPFGVPFAARVERGAAPRVQCALSNEDITDWEKQQTEAAEQTEGAEQAEQEEQTEGAEQAEQEEQTEGAEQAEQEEQTEGPVDLDDWLMPAPKDAQIRERVQTSEVGFFCSEIPPGAEVECTLWYPQDFDPKPSWNEFQFATREYGARYKWHLLATKSELIVAGTRPVVFLALASLLCALTTGWGVLRASRP